MSPVVPHGVFFNPFVFFFSPNMVHSKFFWLYLYFLALFLCHNINFSEESGVIVIEHLTF